MKFATWSVAAVLAATGIGLASPLAASAAPATAKYTTAQVATHASVTDCWAIVGKGVYDLTSYVSRHPGGSQAVSRLCGTNATRAFNAQHGGQGSPAAALRSLKIGTLARG